eukprot:gene2061-biopygen8615
MFGALGSRRCSGPHKRYGWESLLLRYYFRGGINTSRGAQRRYLRALVARGGCDAGCHTAGRSGILPRTIHSWLFGTHATSATRPVNPRNLREIRVKLIVGNVY